MQAIDEHLSQRLQEYQHHIQSEWENTRRIQSLLAAAPPRPAPRLGPAARKRSASSRGTDQ